MIASHIDSDQDLVHFNQSCKNVNHHVENDDSFWRRRFLFTFEKPYNIGAKKWKNLEEFKREYKQRRSCLKNGAVFRLGKTGPERLCLQTLKMLIVGMQDFCFLDGIA